MLDLQKCPNIHSSFRFFPLLIECFHSMNFSCLHRFLNVTYTNIGTVLKVTVLPTIRCCSEEALLQHYPWFVPQTPAHSILKKSYRLINFEMR